MKSSWLWHVNKTEEEVKKILADPGEKRFVHYAALLLSRRRGLPKEIFREYLSKENFCRRWLEIKRKMRKDNWNDQRIPFWDEVYKRLVLEFKKKGVTFPREKKPAVRDPAREKAGRGIRDQRKAAKMTQAGLARRLGVSQQFIAKVESGTQNLSMATLARIRKALGSAPYEYPVDDTPFPAGKISERDMPGGVLGRSDRHPPSAVRRPEITTWFSADLGLRTESR